MPNMMHLTTAARRAATASALGAATHDLDPLSTVILADVLDATSAGVLRAIGLADEEARAVLAILWCGSLSA